LKNKKDELKFEKKKNLQKKEVVDLKFEKTKTKTQKLKTKKQIKI
jgi:hypothetical protein